MAAITTRQTAGSGATVKGAPLTNAEVDANFININAELATAVTSAGTATLTNKTLSSAVYSGVIEDVGSVRSSITAIAALNIDCSLGNFFTKTISGNSTFTVSNVPTSRAYAFTLELVHTSGSITWFSGVQWANSNTPPSLTVNKVHLFVFVTDDGGTTWRGASLPNYNS